MVKHFNNSYSIDIPDLIYEIIIGALLGDGNIKPSGGYLKRNRQVYSVKEYRKAISLLKSFSLISPEFISENLNEIVSQYNLSAEIIRNINTAQFRFHKKLKEQKWMEFLEKIFEQYGYNINLNIKKTVHFDTSSVLEFNELYQSWYTLIKDKNGEDKYIKILPHILPKITPTTLLLKF